MDLEGRSIPDHLLGSKRVELLGRESQLSAEHREVVVLRYFEQMKLSEIAAATGVRTGTIKSRLHYALSALKDILPDELNPSALHGHP